MNRLVFGLFLVSLASPLWARADSGFGTGMVIGYTVGSSGGSSCRGDFDHLACLYGAEHNHIEPAAKIDLIQSGTADRDFFLQVEACGIKGCEKLDPLSWIRKSSGDGSVVHSIKAYDIGCKLYEDSTINSLKITQVQHNGLLHRRTKIEKSIPLSVFNSQETSNSLEFGGGLQLRAVNVKPSPSEAQAVQSAR